MIGGGTVTSCPFPVGYGGFFQIDPNTLYSGTTWEQKKDVFILAAGDTYKAGSTGGEAQHTLTVDEMPIHSHKITKMSWGGNGLNNEINKSYNFWVFDKSNKAGIDISYLQSTGGGQPHNNLPPYFAMPFWIRTA